MIKYNLLFFILSIGFLQSPCIFAADESSWQSTISADTLKKQGCNEEVAKALSDTQATIIKGKQDVAQGLLDKVLGNTSYRTASCLDNMMNMITPKLNVSGSGLDVSNMLSNMACSYSEKMLGPTISNYNSKVSSGQSFLSNTMQIPNVDGLNFGTVMGFQGTTLNGTSNLSSIYRQNVPGWNSNSGNININNVINTNNILGLQ